MTRVRKVGIEEEMFLVDPDSGKIRPVSRRAVQADEREGGQAENLDPELFLQQIEISTEPTTELAELRDHLIAARLRASAAAAAAGVAVLAVPLPLFRTDGDGDLTPKPRYQQMMELYGEVGRRSIVCGMHIHVSISDDEEGVGVIDRLAPWLPVLVALSANSPFDHGVDTDYASWREQVWDGWPSAGPVEPFGDAEGYHDAVKRLVESGAALDEAMVYFDARLAQDYPTVEIRVADVCTDLDDAIVVAALTRALVETCAAATGDEPAWRVEMLRAGRWLARRYGLTGSLLDPRTGGARPAGEVVEVLLDHVKKALTATGDDQVARDGVARLLRDGGGAGRQRAVAGDDLDIEAVARDLLRRTSAAFSGMDDRDTHR